MSESSITECEECLDPDEAFGVLANETRLSILEALWAAEEPPVTFSELRRAVGMGDSAQFNYHLGKLTGQFVTKTDDGYALAHAGRAVVQAVVSGTFNERPELDPFPVEGECSACGHGLQARYEDEQFRIECADCGQCHVRYPFPPGGLADRSRDELVSALDQRVRHFHCLMGDGVCPHCGGTVETAIATDQAFLDLDVAVTYTCGRCDHSLTTPVGMVVLDHVEVVSFYRDHGIDLNDRRAWTLSWITGGESLSVESRDPWELVLTVSLDDERLVLTFDEDLDVIDAERTPAVSAADDVTSPADD
jgi:hypothetical protein